MVTEVKESIVNGVLLIMLSCGRGSGASHGVKGDMDKELSFEEPFDGPEVISDATEEPSFGDEIRISDADEGGGCDGGNSGTSDSCTDSGCLEFHVNTWTRDAQSGPSIASLPNGGFVVVWESYGQDGSGYGVYGQRFDADANKVGSEFRVNTWTTDTQWFSSITSLSDGGFVVVWESGCRWEGCTPQDGSSWGVYGQRFDANASKVGAEFQVTRWTTDDQRFPSITSLPNGGFVVVWESWLQDGSGYGVYGQRFDSNGNKVGSEFQVNTWTTDWQNNPSIASLSDGGFVVVWVSRCVTGECTGQDGDYSGVYGQRFDSNGNKVGSEFRVNTWTTDDQSAPCVASLSNGGFVVVWQSGCPILDCAYPEDTSSWGVFGQMFDSYGNKVGSEFLVNTWKVDYQGYPSVASLSNGGFVVVWQSGHELMPNGQDGSGWGVYGQRFDSNGNKIGSEFQVNTWTTYDQMYPSITSLPNGGFVVVWESNGQDGSSWGVYGRIFSQ
jgi:hypothetical protein